MISVVAGFALVVGGVLLWHRAAPRLTLLCWLIAGIGIAGWLGGFIDRLGGVIGTRLDTLTAKAIGITITGALVAGLAVWLWFGMRKKGPKAKAPKALPWVALMFASLLPLLGGQLGVVGNTALAEFGATLSGIAAEIVVG